VTIFGFGEPSDGAIVYASPWPITHVNRVVPLIMQPCSETRRQIFVDDEFHSAAIGAPSTACAANSNAARMSNSLRLG
jgi:hypothetical protein